MKPLLVTSGEPAGIGPDICLALAAHVLPVVVLGDKTLLNKRALELQLNVQLHDYHVNEPLIMKPNHLTIYSIPCAAPVITGQLNPLNSTYVLQLLTWAADKCIAGEFSGLVTAPIHKAVINQAGFHFTGHTEFLAEHCNAKTVVMMLACEQMKVALVTTHLPLRKVPDAIDKQLIIDVIEQINLSLQKDFNIENPRINVAGLNPHAGEGGYLGQEEIEIIKPAIDYLKNKGINAFGPFPADTLFTEHYSKQCDVFVSMYHDQGLPVLKYAGFGSAVNITLGLPIIRTSVDHGTALELAGTGTADPSSLIAAVKMAESMVKAREHHGTY